MEEGRSIVQKKLLVSGWLVCHVGLCLLPVNFQLQQSGNSKRLSTPVDLEHMLQLILLIVCDVSHSLLYYIRRL